MSDTATFDALADDLGKVGLSPDPAQYHGALCGALCMGQSERINLPALIDGADAVDAAATELINGLRAQIKAALDDSDAGFHPLLPDDQHSLEVRTRALATWCDGFLLGLAGGGKLDLDKASDEVREAVSDITQFTRATLEAGDDADVEEGAYAELVEYLRVVVQLIHLEFTGSPGTAGARMH